MTRTATASRTRALRSFWLLVVVSVLATGGLTSALAAPVSPLTGMRVAVSGVILALSLGLAIRVMLALTVARRAARLTQL